VRSSARVFAAVVAVLVSTVSAHAAARPNVIVILSDDMGFSDLGCYGGEIRTPNLDRLAAGGVRFTQFYNTARCCPTRASLLTGLYPHQAGIGHMMDDKGLDGYRGDLNRRCRTFGEVLRPAGYRTYAVGKWHVTKATQPDGPQDNWPLQRGFDRYYGTIHGAGSFYDPSTLVRDNTMLTAFNDHAYQPETYYYTDALAHHATQFVNDHAKQQPQQPFFLYVAFTAAHWPMHALEEGIAKYRGKYDGGYAPIRAARFAKAKQLGLIHPQSELTRPERAWDSVEHKEWEARCMEVYAAMIDRMDQGIGKLVAALAANGQLDNTLICYLQDNGGCAEAQGRQANQNHPGGPRAEQPSLPPLSRDFFQTGSTPLQTRDGFPVRMGPLAMPGPADTYIAYGPGWANVSNTPFREYKHWVHEGGISTPLIAHWPDGIAARGELRTQPGHLIDIMATCVELSGAKYSADATPLEGRSLVPAFRNEPIQRDAIYWEHEGNRAIRVGDWKLVAKGPAGKWELYHIANDRTELHDLATEQPQRVQDLRKQWETWAQRASVLPWISKPAYQLTP
jgi:arylsulfatase A-like enzyme